MEVRCLRMRSVLAEPWFVHARSPLSAPSDTLGLIREAAQAGEGNFRDIAGPGDPAEIRLELLVRELRRHGPDLHRQESRVVRKMGSSGDASASSRMLRLLTRARRSTRTLPPLLDADDRRELGAVKLGATVEKSGGKAVQCRSGQAQSEQGSLPLALLSPSRPSIQAKHTSLYYTLVHCRSRSYSPYASTGAQDPSSVSWLPHLMADCPVRTPPAGREASPPQSPA